MKLKKVWMLSVFVFLFHMKNFMKKFFDKSLVIFLIIGACNTVLSLALQFALFNWAHFG